MYNIPFLNNVWQEIFEAFSKGGSAAQTFGITIGIIFFLFLLLRPLLKLLPEKNSTPKNIAPLQNLTSKNTITRKVPAPTGRKKSDEYIYIQFVEKETIGKLNIRGEYYEATKIIFSDNTSGEINFETFRRQQKYFCNPDDIVYCKNKEDCIQKLYIKLHPKKSEK